MNAEELSKKWGSILSGSKNNNYATAMLIEGQQQRIDMSDPKNPRVIEQKDPEKNELPAVWDLVIKDMQDRDKEGERKYKTRLQPFNGRDALIDVYQEMLDAVVYMRQIIYERDKK